MYAIITDIANILIIISFIRIMYTKCYEECACTYMKNQLSIICSSSLSCVIVLRTYYYFENQYQIDEMYMGGMISTLFFLAGGLLCQWMYKHYFRYGDSKYDPTDEEYLFMVSISFMAVSIKMATEKVIGMTVPVALLLGRFIWLDTQSIQSIIQSIKVKHMRVLESSVLFFVGMIILSCIANHPYMPQNIDSWIAMGYGLVVCFPYKYFRNKLFK